MSEQDLAEAFKRLEDDAVRDKVAAGDLSDLGDVTLTDEERELLEAAASDYPEVVGHSINFNLLGTPDLKSNNQDFTIKQSISDKKIYPSGPPS